MCQDIQIRIISQLKVNKAVKPKAAVNSVNIAKNNVMSKLNKGFTLIEVLVAILIFGITALSLSYTLTSGLKVTSRNQDMVTANNYAKEYLEDIAQEWQDPAKFESGTTLPIPMSSTYNPDNRFNVTVNNPENMVTDEKGAVIVRRIQVTYKTSDNKPLVFMFMDYSKPGLST